MEPTFSSDALLEWFSRQKRPLPWRKHYAPYEVWISETMAQQTRIDQMLPYYASFLQKFPTVEKLASAPYKDVLKAWEGLGYYTRASNLHQAAKQVVNDYHGKLPTTRAELLALKGFGPYIASAVASIAFEEDVPVVDGNVLRVMARFWGREDDIAQPQTRLRFEKELQEILPKGKARDFNQGLMELGALVCTPKQPTCFQCPLQKNCRAYQENKTSTLPVKTRKKTPPTRHFAAVVVQNENGDFWLMKRSEKLLSDMWEFPMVEYLPLQEDKNDLEKKLSQKGGGPIHLGVELGIVHHQYTHFHQIVHVFDGSVNPGLVFRDGFAKESALKKMPLPKVQHKILSLLHPKKKH